MKNKKVSFLKTFIMLKDHHTQYVLKAFTVKNL